MGMKALVSFVFFFMAIFSLCAQSTFLGKVSDSESQTLPGAQVILLKADTLFAATLTDQDGKFVFRDIPADVYGLQILAMGYTPIEEKERKTAFLPLGRGEKEKRPLFSLAGNTQYYK